jgi:hypothetical protein
MIFKTNSSSSSSAIPGIKQINILKNLEDAAPSSSALSHHV